MGQKNAERADAAGDANRRWRVLSLTGREALIGAPDRAQPSAPLLGQQV